MIKVSANHSAGKKDKSMVAVVEWNPSTEQFTIIRSQEENEFIHWLFNNRCIGLDEPCYEIASDIAHIEGRETNDDWTNKVLLCRKCHREWHRRGVSDEDIARLKERRTEYLEMIGREQYI